MNKSLASWMAMGLCPKAKAAAKCIIVVAEASLSGEVLEQPGVATAQHNVVRLQCSFELSDDFVYVVAPFSFSETLQSGQSNVIFVGAAILVGQVSQLHGLKDAVDDQRRTEASPQTEKEHPPAPITAQRLHGSVVDDFDRPADGFLTIEPDPARTEVMGLADRASVNDGARVADGDCLIFPGRSSVSDSLDHFSGGHI